MIRKSAPSRFLSATLSLCLTMGIMPLHSQTPPGPAPNKPIVNPDSPPEEKAFLEAMRSHGATKKVAPLDQFILAYPKSSFIRQAHLQALTTLIQRETDQRNKIMKRAQKVVQGTAGIEKIRACNSVASALLQAGVYLNDAAKYSRKSLKATTPQKFLTEQKADYLKRKQTLPPDAEILKRYRTTLSACKATLGQIYSKQKKYGEAETLLQDAYANNENLEATALLALAQLAEKKGRKEEAYQYLLKPVLRGQATPSLQSRFETLYQERNQGSLAGLEKELDTQYQRLFPNPVKAETYRPTPSRSDRVVLAELYTGAGCPPCAGADLAFDAALERYGSKELALLTYHLHIPRPDPMTNPDTVERSKQLQVRSTPSWFLDGKKDGGGGTRDTSPEIYEKKLLPSIDQRLDVPSQATLHLDASADHQNVRVRCTVEKVQSPSADLKLRIALAENHIRYTGENGIRFHAMAVRSLASYPLPEGPISSIDHSFDLKKISLALKEYLDQFENNNERFGKIRFREKKHLIDPSHLSLVAFLENEKEKTILQAIRLDLPKTAEDRKSE